MITNNTDPNNRALRKGGVGKQAYKTKTKNSKENKNNHNFFY